MTKEDPLLLVASGGQAPRRFQGLLSPAVATGDLESYTLPGLLGGGVGSGVVWAFNQSS